MAVVDVVSGMVVGGQKTNDNIGSHKDVATTFIGQYVRRLPY